MKPTYCFSIHWKLSYIMMFILLLFHRCCEGSMLPKMCCCSQSKLLLVICMNRENSLHTQQKHTFYILYSWDLEYARIVIMEFFAILYASSHLEVFILQPVYIDRWKKTMVQSYLINWVWNEPGKVPTIHICSSTKTAWPSHHLASL